MKRLGSAIALCIAVLWSPLSPAALVAELDRTEVRLGDSLTLTLRATDKEDFSNLKLTALQRDFAINSSKRNSSFSMVNGKTEFVSELELVLSPRRPGQLRIPSLHLDGSLSKPIIVRVADYQDSAETQDNVFVEVEVDRESVYVQAQLIFSFRVYRAIQVDELRLSPLELPGVVVESLGDNTYQRQHNGKTYLVTELKYALFPQQSGDLLIPSLSFSGRERSSRLSLSTVRLRTRELAVEVKPIPANYPDATWLPSQQVDIDETWSVAPASLGLGDSVTRTITLTAQGISGNQLPAVELENTPGLKVYQDQPKSESLTDERGIKGLAISSAALLLVAAGDYQLRPVRIPWWDTQSDQLRFAELPARELSIAPAPINQLGGSGNEDVATAGGTADRSAILAQQTRPIWFWATLLCGAGWALTTLLLWRRRLPGAPMPTAELPLNTSEKQLFRELKSAAKASDNSILRTALLAWGQTYFASPQRNSLAELSRQIDDEAVKEELALLEQSLFAAGASHWQGTKLIELLTLWRKQHHIKSAGTGPAPLPPLYG